MKYTVVVTDPSSLDSSEAAHLEASFATLRQALAFQHNLLEELPERTVQLIQGDSEQIVSPKTKASNRPNKRWKIIFLRRLRRAKSRSIS